MNKLTIETLTTDSLHTLGIITLDNAKALNAIDADMCQNILAQLIQWHNDDTIVAVILRGSGDKAFCAGGDIRKLYHSAINQTSTTQVNPYAEEFFSSEYQLNKYMHFFKKPIINWASGIVMGGGMGLMSMSSHRVVTDTTRFAMPEISIGLYPDATGSWTLQHMPQKVGLFLGLTASHGNGADALIGNIAEYAMASDDYQTMVNTLIQADWHNATTDSLHHIASRALGKVHTTDHLAQSNFIKHWQIINSICNQGSIADIDKKLRSEQLADHYANDIWITRAIDNYKHGCPVSSVLTYKIFQRAKSLSLEQALYMEFNLSLNCINNADFREGVRALLIDKDKSPQWSKTLAECLTTEGQDYINSHFELPYSDYQHPFADWLKVDSIEWC